MLRPDDLFTFQSHASAWGLQWGLRSPSDGKQLFIRSKDHEEDRRQKTKNQKVTNPDEQEVIENASPLQKHKG